MMKRSVIVVYWGFALALYGCVGTQSDRAFQKNKENFIRTIEADLSRMDRRIDRFIEASETFQNDAEAELNAQLVEMVREKNKIGRKLEYLRAATPNIWPYMKTDLEEAMLDLEQLLKETGKTMSLTYDGQSLR